VIRTNSCGVCGTDLEILKGSLPAGFTRYPLVPGHEWTGVVEEAGSPLKAMIVMTLNEAHNDIAAVGSSQSSF